MFNRTRTTDAKTTGVSAIDDILAELETSTAAGVAPEPTEAADVVAEPAEDTTGDEELTADQAVAAHTASLRATRDAQEQAQAMLALAATERQEAAEQAEKLVLEAQAVADRLRASAAAEAEGLRRDAVAWTTLQRERVEEATQQIAAKAERDAEQQRADAMTAAMAEAEQSARLYVGEAAARGARDAEEIRGQARDLLHRASTLGGEIQESLAQITVTLESSMEQVRDRLAQIDRLLAEARGESGTREVPAADTPAPTTPLRSVADAAARAERAEQVEGDDEVEPDSFAEPTRRQLGALFRDLDSAGA